jgi:hypothetical protein
METSIIIYRREFAFSDFNNKIIKFCIITLAISGNTVVENTTHNSKMKGSNRAAGYKREREIFMT